MKVSLRILHTKILLDLKNSDFPKKHPKEYLRFKYCCSSEKLRMDCKNGHEIVRFYNRCRLNFCPFCCHMESIKRYKKALGILICARLDDPDLFIHFLTFTLKTGPSLAIQLKKIKKSITQFRHPRRNPYWKEICVGGFQSIEVTKSKGKWNAHCHILLISKLSFLDYARNGKIKSAWYRITGDSHVMRGKRVDDIKDIKEVFKYALKYDESEFSKKDMLTFCEEMSRCRTYTTFGNVYNQSQTVLDDIIKRYDKDLWNEYNDALSYHTICPECKEATEWEVNLDRIVPAETLALRVMGKNRAYKASGHYRQYQTDDNKPLTHSEKHIVENYMIPRTVAIEVERNKTLLDKIKYYHKSNKNNEKTGKNGIIQVSSKAEIKA